MVSDCGIFLFNPGNSNTISDFLYQRKTGLGWGDFFVTLEDKFPVIRLILISFDRKRLYGMILFPLQKPEKLFHRELLLPH
jgi:hypothetical protein